MIPVQFLMASAVVPSLLLIWYFHSRDAYPEPLGVLAKTFVLGVLTIPPVLMVALPVMHAIEGIGDPITAGFLQAFLTAAGPEEFFKFLVVWLYASRHKEFDEPMDGIVYGATASLGFATLENILYVSSGGLGIAVMRALMAVPCHAFMGAIMGYYVGQAKFRPNERGSLLLKAYLIPFLLHGLYDAPLLAMKGYQGQTPDPLALVLLPVSFIVLIVEWIWTVKLIRRLRSEQAAWAATHPSASTGAQQPYAPQYAQQAQGYMQPQGYGQPQPGYAYPYGYNPYTVQPQWAPMAQPPSGASTGLGVLMIVFGVLLAGAGGMVTLGGLLLLGVPADSPTGQTAPGVIIVGVVPLVLGVLLFIFGIKRLNTR
jgi:RsiW-degrading membrane proteinase PrsW (M82 family)